MVTCSTEFVGLLSRASICFHYHCFVYPHRLDICHDFSLVPYTVEVKANRGPTLASVTIGTE